MFSSRTSASYLTLIVSLVVLALKFGAYLLTGSVALLSDAAESVVNVIAGVAVVFTIRLAQQPPDYEHPYGHAKAETMSSALEGSLILIAAGMILVTSSERLFNPEPLGNVTAGVVIAVVALVVNGVTSLYLRRLGKNLDSGALRSNARHLLTDVWTSVGVLLAVILVVLTGWDRLDPLIAMLVGLNIVREGWSVLSGSLSELLDTRLPEGEEETVIGVLDADVQVLGYHRLRSRRAGHTRYLEVDIFVEPTMSVEEAHTLVTRLEDTLITKLPNLMTTVHIEPFKQGLRDERRPPKQEYI